MALAVAVARQGTHNLRSCLQRIIQAVTLAKFLQLSAIMAVAVGGGVAIESVSSSLWHSNSRYKRFGTFLTTNDANSQDDEEHINEKSKNDGEADNAPKEQSELSSAMIATIGVYKNFISPLLPPACRFVPTCSQYGVQAIQEFGPCKGVILTLWRLLRCSPFGGKGYDPPKWPPVPYTYSSY
jgi:putative membrane protein insertion efficiency factor